MRGKGTGFGGSGQYEEKQGSIKGHGRKEMFGVACFKRAGVIS